MGACRACCQKTTLQAATYPGSNERSCQIQRLENKGREKHTGNFGKRAKLKNYSKITILANRSARKLLQTSTSNNLQPRQTLLQTPNSLSPSFPAKKLCAQRNFGVSGSPSPSSCHRPSPFCHCPPLPGDGHSTPRKGPAEQSSWMVFRTTKSWRFTKRTSRETRETRETASVLWQSLTWPIQSQSNRHRKTKKHTNLREELQRHRNGTHFQLLPRTRWTMFETTATKTPHPLDQSKWQLEYRWKWHDPTPSNSWCFRRYVYLIWNSARHLTPSLTSRSRSWSES